MCAKMSERVSLNQRVTLLWLSLFAHVSVLVGDFGVRLRRSRLNGVPGAELGDARMNGVVADGVKFPGDGGCWGDWC